MNEELETAKEELQSANEELTTVNEELQNRNSELAHVAADLGNLLASVNIPIVMLSRDLRIRRYTPSATKVLNLIQSDIGRPITDINLNLSIPDLEAVLFQSMESMSPREREVSDKSGRRYLLRVQPFKTLENRIDGVVMMLLDRESFPGDAERSGFARECACAIADVIDRPAVVIDEERTIQSANQAFRNELRLEGDLAGRHLQDALTGIANREDLQQLVALTIERDDHSDPIEISIAAENGEPRRYRAAARRVKLRTAGDPTLILIQLESAGG
jgi:two-component system CheB/CheR fusion protein